MSLAANDQGSDRSSGSEFPVAFGRYLLLKRLSRGGMGEIFLAKVGEIRGFEKFVIIKKILPQLAENEEFITRFIDEAQVAIKLNHVNIAQVYEVGRVDGEYFLAIEFIDGRDVRRILRRCRDTGTRLPVDLCLFVARDLAAGLAYAHRRQVKQGQALALVHCDISPPNVMVSYEGEVKIIDFGIARSALRTADSNPNVGFGKFGYMAPEQLIRGGVIDRRTDIYAAGVVLYELLTGERLYQFPEGTDYRQMARAVCQGNYLAPSSRDNRLDVSIDAILARALAVKQEHRFQLAEEFRDALQRKLSQINPTISADRLARVMEELFGTERLLETDEFAQMRAVDPSAYKEEIVGGVGHTVTFARAIEDGLVEEGPTTVTPLAEGGQDKEVPPLPKADEAARSATAVTPGTLTPSFLRESRGRRTWVLPALLGVLGFFGVVAGGMWLLRTQPRPVGKVDAGALPKPAEQPRDLAEKAGPVDLAVVDLSPTSASVEAKPRPEQTPKNPKKRPVAVAKSVKEKRDTKEPIVPEQVDRKFKEVKAEYLDFRSVFGARLESEWQAILSDIALGRRDERVSDALDALRRQMKTVRAESKK